MIQLEYTLLGGGSPPPPSTHIAILLATQVPVGQGQQYNGQAPPDPVPIYSVAPVTLEVPIASVLTGIAALDLTTVTAWAFEVRDPDSHLYVWTPTASGITTTSGALLYTLIGTELPTRPCGTWQIRVIATTTAGKIPFWPPSKFRVVPF